GLGLAALVLEQGAQAHGLPLSRLRVLSIRPSAIFSRFTVNRPSLMAWRISFTRAMSMSWPSALAGPGCTLVWGGVAAALSTWARACLLGSTEWSGPCGVRLLIFTLSSSSGILSWSSFGHGFYRRGPSLH